jgi:hypothetical protein
MGKPFFGGPVQGGTLRRLILLLLIAAVGSALAQRAEYPGPTILSRGTGTVLKGGGDLLQIRPYLSLDAVYDTALTAVSVDSEGEIPQTDGYGGEVGFGVYGYHNWRRTLLGVDYRGNYRKYSRKSYFDGTDQTLNLSVTHQAARRIVITLRETGGTFSRGFGSFGGSQFFDPAYSYAPSDELFDSRTYYLSTLGDLTFNKSSRLSFNMGGTGMLVRRRSQALGGMTGWIARGDVSYRAGRTFTIGADYSFTHFDFTRAFGASDVHTAALDLAFRLGRRWDLGLRAGGSRVETLGLRRVAIDPVIAAIIRQTQGIEVFHGIQYIPSGEASLSRAFRRSSLSFGYRIGADPGNGLLLTSKAQSATVSYSHTAYRRWNVGFSGGYHTLASLSQVMGKYESYNAGGGFTCKLKSWLHLVGRYDARRYTIDQSVLRRINHRVTLGIAFSPGDLPLSLW